MAILIYGEHSDGKFKKGAFEAATFAARLSATLGNLPVHAVVLGPLDAAELLKLGQYGVDTIHHDATEHFGTFESQTAAAAVAVAAQASGSQHIVFAQSYNGRAAAPRVAVKLSAAFLSGIHSVPSLVSDRILAKRQVFSNKGIQTIGTGQSPVVYTLRGNAFQPEEKPAQPTVSAFSSGIAPAGNYLVVSKEMFSEEVSLTEAETVVSAGRGLQGPQNWAMIEALAHELGAATACSKPVSDLDWRPHHEHVGQTGIQISPNVYIAIGISGAIQHLAGVSSSKTIIVVNKDAEAPFFKAADFGVVGDAFEVVPKLLDAVKAHKASR